MKSQEFELQQVSNMPTWTKLHKKVHFKTAEFIAMKTSFQFAYTRDKKLVMQSKRTNPLKHDNEYHLVLYKE